MRIWLFCILAIFASCANEKTNGKPSEDRSDFYVQIALADSLFIKRDSVRAFVKLRHSVEIIEVLDFNNWPDSVEVTYNVCYDAGKVILYKEIPENEFDEYSVYYSYYVEGDLVFAVDLEARYFNEHCSESAIVENKLYAFEKDLLTLKRYSLTNMEGTLVDSASCSFGKSPDFRKYKTLTETPIADFMRGKTNN